MGEAGRQPKKKTAQKSDRLGGPWQAVAPQQGGGGLVPVGVGHLGRRGQGLAAAPRRGGPGRLVVAPARRRAERRLAHHAAQPDVRAALHEQGADGPVAPARGAHERGVIHLGVAVASSGISPRSAADAAVRSASSSGVSSGLLRSFIRRGATSDTNMVRPARQSSSASGTDASSSSS
ncbi:unnamed protein product [Prorocentrum cordatum]|uniref:Uncharacterized protein n=1 Tax=Prorocentrum cordatum TaxID=2364126 RepID=A0ABN9UVG3_9DINO|nr:unnamed protein product [Polarella glacialis]